jgi:hypothetical protein
MELMSLLMEGEREVYNSKCLNNLNCTMLIAKTNATHIYVSLIVLALTFWSCGNQGLQFTTEVDLNPNKISPLTAVIHLSANKPCVVTVTVQGKSPVEQVYKTDSNKIDVPVIGLYPGRVNQVLVSVQAGEEVQAKIVEIKTKPLPESFPTIEINSLDRHIQARAGCLAGLQ